jgi:purine-binding chemotaxis protein CheW
MPTPRLICTFFLDGHLFGVDVLQVQEVIRHQEMTRVPLADPVLCGLINLRGQIVTALDLRLLLRHGARPDSVQPVNVVIGTDCGTISLLADEVGEVIEVDGDRMEPPPPTVDAVARSIVEGVVRLKDSLLMLIDPAKVIRCLDAETAPAA